MLFLENHLHLSCWYVLQSSDHFFGTQPHQRWKFTHLKTPWLCYHWPWCTSSLSYIHLCSHLFRWRCQQVVHGPVVVGLLSAAFCEPLNILTVLESTVSTLNWMASFRIGIVGSSAVLPLRSFTKPGLICLSSPHLPPFPLPGFQWRPFPTFDYLLDVVHSQYSYANYLRDGFGCNSARKKTYTLWEAIFVHT